MCEEVGQQAWGLGLRRTQAQGEEAPCTGRTGREKQDLSAEPADALPTNEPQGGTWCPPRET